MTTDETRCVPFIIVRNETAARLCVAADCGDGAGRLVIGPFESIAVTQGQWDYWQRDLRILARRRKVALQAPPAESDGSGTPVILTTLTFWAILGLAITGLVIRTASAWQTIGIVAAAIIILALAVGGIASLRARGRGPHLMRALYLLLSIAAAAVIPAVTIYVGANLGHDFAALGGPDSAGSEFVLLARAVQCALIFVGAFLPAGLFFLFDRLRLATLRETFERDMLRFDPTVSTLSEVRARYGAVMGEVFPTARADAHCEPADDLAAVAPPTTSSRRSGGRVSFEREAPVLLATVTIALAWSISVLNPDLTFAGEGHRSDYVLGLLQPHASPVVFAFLGSYSFTLFTLQRSYVRSDLRPKSYTNAVVRIIFAVISAWVLSICFPGALTDNVSGGGDLLLATAFLVGFLPETLLVRLQDLRRRVTRGTSLERIYEGAPLTQLVGVDIYDRSRLLDEGIESVEGLAHHNLPQLMLQTRIPVGRIVHWADQAILHLHIVSADDAPTGGDASGHADAKGHAATIDGNLRTLKTYGIYTATDLLKARPAQADSDPEARERFLGLLDGEAADGPTAGPLRLEMIIKAIKDEQWIHHLRHWHERIHDETTTIWVDASGEIRSRAGHPATPPDLVHASPEPAHAANGS